MKYSVKRALNLPLEKRSQDFDFRVTSVCVHPRRVNGIRDLKSYFGKMAENILVECDDDGNFLHGKRPDGRARFGGRVIEITYGGEREISNAASEVTIEVMETFSWQAYMQAGRPKTLKFQYSLGKKE